VDDLVLLPLGILLVRRIVPPWSWWSAANDHAHARNYRRVDASQQR